jgi:hypothetical protein
MKCLPGSHRYTSVADKVVADMASVSRTLPVVFQVPMKISKGVIGFVAITTSMLQMCVSGLTVRFRGVGPRAAPSACENSCPAARPLQARARLESGDKIPEQTALLVRGSKQSAPNAVNLLDDVHLPRLATDGAILDERLVLAAFFVDEQLDRFAAVGTACHDDFGHRISGQEPNDSGSGAPGAR